MSEELGVALVHYRTPALVAPAVRALVSDCETTGVRARIVLVDNGSEADSRAAWRELPIELDDAGDNLGYAAGVARGVARLASPRLLAMNPDVVVRPGCVAALLAALDSGAAAVGPRFEWDEQGRLFLPPTEERTRTAELLAALAPSSPAWARRARRRWRRHARRHWLARAPLPSRSLSGALIAFRREAWERVGPFDEGYRLYFEETDWLSRLAAARLPSLYVPAARAWHLYAQSSAREPHASAWFAAAAARYRRRAYGPLFTALLARIERPQPLEPEPAQPIADPALPGAALGAAPVWIEAAPTPWGFPAAAERLASGAPRRRPPAAPRASCGCARSTTAAASAGSG
jgi:GT2 family glycosyltransferase